MTSLFLFIDDPRYCSFVPRRPCECLNGVEGVWAIAFVLDCFLCSFLFRFIEDSNLLGYLSYSDEAMDVPPDVIDLSE